MLTLRAAAQYLGIPPHKLYQAVIIGRGPTAVSEEPALSTLAGGPKRIHRLYRREDLDAWQGLVDQRKREYKESICEVSDEGRA